MDKITDEGQLQSLKVINELMQREMLRNDSLPIGVVMVMPDDKYTLCFPPIFTAQISEFTDKVRNSPSDMKPSFTPYDKEE